MCNNKKEIILFKRASSAKYDFGYVKLEVCNIEINGIKKYIEKYYLDNFGVTVEVESKIYETYFVDKGEKRILGLRFLGVQKDDKLPKIKVSKYDSFKKVNVNNYTTLSYIEQNEFISLIGKIFQDKEGENNGME